MTNTPEKSMKILEHVNEYIKVAEYTKLICISIYNEQSENATNKSFTIDFKK